MARTTEKKADASAPAPVRHTRVLHPGESMVLNRQAVELEIVLFRPLHPMNVAVASITGTPSKSSAKALGRKDDSMDGELPGGTSSVSHRVVVTSPRASIVKEHPPARVGRGGRRRKSSTLEGGAASPAPAPSAFSAAATPTTTTLNINSGGFRPPLFFDTTACLFQDSLNRSDYVATGRHATDTKALLHKPHAVVTGSESATANSFCNYNVNTVTNETEDSEMEMDMLPAEPMDHSPSMVGWGQPRVARDNVSASNGPVVMAAGDGVVVNFRRIGTCTGALVSATLFSNDIPLSGEHNVYYMVRKPKSVHPICLVPVSVPDARYQGSVAMMLRRVKVKGEASWELTSVSEPLLQKDVKSVVQALQCRGLRNPVGYQRSGSIVVVGEVSSSEEWSTSSSRSSSYSASSSSSSSSASPDGSDAEEGEESESESLEKVATVAAVTSGRSATVSGGESRHHRKPSFDDLLAGVEHVVREGRRQYNVGRSHVRPMLGDGASSDEDEVLDDALRAVVPQYVNSSVVRYEDSTYNVGSRSRVMVSHYVDRREVYALDDAGRPRLMSPNKLSALHPNHLLRGGRRLTDESTVAHQRPEPPLELLPDDVIAARMGGATPHQRKSSSNSGSRRRSSERRRRLSRRSTRRGASGSKRSSSRSLSASRSRSRSRSRRKRKSRKRRSKRRSRRGRSKKRRSSSRKGSAKQPPSAQKIALQQEL